MIKKDGTISNIQSERNKAWWRDPIYRARMIAMLKGQHHSKASIAKANATKKAFPSKVWNTPEFKAKISAIHKGLRLSEEAKLKISLAHKGKKRKPFSDETKAKISLALKGRIIKPETKEKLRIAATGKHLSDEARMKLSIALTGKKWTEAQLLKRKNTPSKKPHFSEEARKSISEKAKGRKWSLESRIKASESHRGDKSPLWKGGASYEPYTIGFGRTIKRIIRERDQYICQLCFKDTRTLTCDHAIHHIDYDKKNCDHLNLILLCHLCHVKTNMNRDWWTIHFQELMKSRHITSNTLGKYPCK